ncbi:hypothetical protein FRC98_02790 [Lujinxingia vulgaris]|uniref:NADH-quinone oxidoreductase subunit J n=2 Tax=Lujinxingia vulgaris TaxID=2600176 RepID=A0A5C6XP08_9DELT|nr:hypothetical protein FRC98_02790 [Lujinxingia vulgaris]
MLRSWPSRAYASRPLAWSVSMGFWEPLFFWMFALGALVTSLTVILVRNPLYSALALIVDFFFFAGLYVLLSAHFLAIVQVLVYGGAIMVLFLFIIMLLNLRDEELGENRFQLHFVAAIASGLAIFFFAGASILAVVSDEKVDQGRQEYARQVEQAEEGERVARITGSEIPGLAADLNEEGLERSYQAQLAAWEAGQGNPARGKYNRFDTTVPFELPPALSAETREGSVTPGRQGLYGTFKPISIALVNRFVVPFELTAILLLAAIIGAMIIAKRRVA